MKTVSDYGQYVVVNLILEIEGEMMVEMTMQPDDKGQGLGVAIVKWEDFSLSDFKDLLALAAGSVGRFLDDAPGITVEEDKTGPAIEQGWPF